MGITDAREELQKMLREDELQGVSLLDCQWYIQGCSANTGDGLHEGLDWLSVTMKSKSKAKNFAKSRTLATVEPTKDRHTGRSVKDTADRDSVADTVSTADTETLQLGE